ncbi:FAD-dependent monooxygenase [Nocardia brasiliensis]|uniref:FAD-dependent monooxygenase n=1 Tax=Nocardia brasiliensis TaxID=37326 RepID=UPI0024565FD0|nr:FAD-dependent monooxygenase [Nocardia brasiliensis]
MNRSAMVVGGGIGGLTAAIALRRIGWDVTVLERASTLGEVGAGMSQSPNALRAFDAIGVGEHVRRAGVPFHAPDNLRTPSGEYLIRAQRPDRSTPLLGFHRADLHRALLDQVPPGCVRTGAEVTDIRQTAERVTVICQGEELCADLVIAADGAHSTVRRVLWPDAPQPRFWGNTVWRSIAKLDGVQGSLTMSRGQNFLIMPVSDGRAYWALWARAERAGIRYDNELAEVRRRVSGWHDPIPALLDATPADAVLHHDLADLEKLSTYVQGRVALLGDAAHVMHPDMGQGAGQSVEDAVVLAAALAEADTVTEALTRYDEQRRPRTQTIVGQARKKSLSATSPNRFSYHTQNLILRMIPDSKWPNLAERALEPVWNWAPPQLPNRHN